MRRVRVRTPRTSFAEGSLDEEAAEINWIEAIRPLFNR